MEMLQPQTLVVAVVVLVLDQVAITMVVLEDQVL
tara:strand:- start:40 stop:141 length:102 start_codon:yes stop_codon:yes gene_type:complete